MKELHDRLFYCQCCSSTTRPLLLSSCMHMTCTTCTTKLTTCAVCHSTTELVQLTEQLKATLAYSPSRLLEQPVHVLSFQLESVVSRMVWLDNERMRYRGLLVRAGNELMRVKKMRGIRCGVEWGKDSGGKDSKERNSGSKDRNRNRNKNSKDEDRNKNSRGRDSKDRNSSKDTNKHINKNDVNKNNVNVNNRIRYENERNVINDKDRRSVINNINRNKNKSRNKRDNSYDDNSYDDNRRNNSYDDNRRNNSYDDRKITNRTITNISNRKISNISYRNSSDQRTFITSTNNHSNNSSTDYLKTIKFTKRMMKPKEHVHKERSTGNEHMKRMCEGVRRESSTEITSECVGRLSIPVKRSRRFFYRKRGDER